MKANINNKIRKNKAFGFVAFMFFIFLFVNVSLRAQQLPNDCASTDPCNAPWNEVWIEPQYASDYTSQEAFIFACRIHLFYRWCNGQVQLMIDWDETECLNGNFFNTGQFFEKDFSGLKEFVEYKTLLFALDWGVIPGVPNCIDNNDKVVVTFYTARCGVWIKCSYKVDLSVPVERDDCYQGNCPSPLPHNGQPYVDVWKWQSCGETCCKKTL
ncbi:hypothetical protein D9V84_10800 [Bacteroidetes/Chlorobi group bacterium Naka2016]|jgi:hypothetical protein|nr:MAG: hypothetical protein D9V84_10800 [Bacteroidetes/Chlorobi group bacterium Naka2016]